MNALNTFTSTKITLIGIVTAALTLSCGSFQGASYYDSDGIYTSRSVIRQTETPTQASNSNYYSSYFKDAAEGYTDVSNDQLYFTNTNGYYSENNTEYQSQNTLNNQIPWGGQTTRTEVILVDNRPNYLWGLSGFAFSHSPYWRSYYYNPYRYGYGYVSYYNPYYGYGGYWGGYDPFYSPYYYAGYYNGYYGFGWNYGYRWHNPHRWNRWSNYHDYRSNSWYRNNRYNTTVARSSSRRGEKTYDNRSRDKQNKNSQQSKNRSADIQQTISRINVGRGAYSYGSVGSPISDRENVLGSKAGSGRSQTARPVFESTTSQGAVRSNSNPSKTIQSNTGRNINNGFTQSRYLGNRNRTQTTSPRSNAIFQGNINNPRIIQNNSSRSINNSRPSVNTRSVTPSRNYSNSTQYKSAPPSRSMSSGSSRSYSSGSSSSGRSSSGGRRNNL